jgi:23S rRNA (pseudouridine1915-N3)-methyltransferase
VEVHLTRTDLIVVGSLSTEIAAIADDYERRLTRYVKLHVHEAKAEPTARGQQVVLRAEADRLTTILDRVEQQVAEPSTIIALDSAGATPTTEQLAERWLGARHLVLLVGGTMGLPPEVLRRASGTVSFGRITLPHQLARVVATEQLYRAFRIARGEPYHF